MAESSNVDPNSREVYCSNLFNHEYPMQCSYKHIQCESELESLDVRQIVCEFNLYQTCRYGDNCEFLHFTPSEQYQVGKGETPSVEQIRETFETNLSEHEVTETNIETTKNTDDQDILFKQSPKYSPDKQECEISDQNPICVICLENIAEKSTANDISFEGKEIYGLMSGCSHVFCLECIKKWRKSSESSSEENSTGHLNVIRQIFEEIYEVTFAFPNNGILPFLHPYAVVFTTFNVHLLRNRYDYYASSEQPELNTVNQPQHEHLPELDTQIPDLDEPFQLPKETTKTCPICRAVSLFVIPSSKWVDNETEKNKLLEELMKKYSEIKCRYFSSFGVCKFKKNCMFLHSALNSKPVISKLEKKMLR